MRITGLRAIPVAVPFREDELWAFGGRRGMISILLEVIRHGAADVVEVDNQMDGGLLNLKRSAGMCEAAGLPVVKHSLGELGIAVYAALHVMAATPNFLHANQSYASFLADDVVAGASPLPYRDGHLEVPRPPGIGVELDAERVARFEEVYLREGEFSVYGPVAERHPA